MQIARCDIWLVDFDPTEGHEQRGTRPALIVSSDLIDLSTVEMTMVIPGTKTEKYDPITKMLLPDVFRIDPSPQNGLDRPTFFLCSQLRSISTRRLIGRKRIGRITFEQMLEIEDILIMLLDLGPK